MFVLVHTDYTYRRSYEGYKDSSGSGSIFIGGVWHIDIPSLMHSRISTFILPIYSASFNTVNEIFAFIPKL
jgi:hypothetical protein